MLVLLPVIQEVTDNEATSPRRVDGLTRLLHRDGRAIGRGAQSKLLHKHINSWRAGFAQRQNLTAPAVAAAIGVLVTRGPCIQTGCKMTIIMPRPAGKVLSRQRQQRTASALRDCHQCEVRSVSICSVLTGGDMRVFEALGQQARFQPRAILFAEGEPAEAVYNITGGVARLYRLLYDGSRQVVGFGFPGDFLGLPLGGRYSFSADAAELITACRFSRLSFSRFLDERPQFMRRVYEMTTHGLDLAHDQMVLLGRPNARAKVAAFLIGLRERWARVRSASLTVALPMGRQDIADFLGLSIATVSRTLHRLADDGLILIFPKGVRILDLERLRRAAQA